LGAETGSRYTGLSAKFSAGASRQHERNMKSDTGLTRRRESTNQLPNGCHGGF
jgi:hypothetical protein